MVLVREEDENTRVVLQELLQSPKQAEVVVTSLLYGTENNMHSSVLLLIAAIQ